MQQGLSIYCVLLISSVVVGSNGESSSACIARITKRASGTFRRARAQRADASKPRGCAQRIRRSILRASTRLLRAGSATDLLFCCCGQITRARRIGARKTGFALFALETNHRTVSTALRAAAQAILSKNANQWAKYSCSGWFGRRNRSIRGHSRRPESPKPYKTPGRSRYQKASITMTHCSPTLNRNILHFRTIFPTT